MTLANLDYPAERLVPFGRDKLLLEADTDFERVMRITACAKEPWTVAAIETLAPGEVLWDVGANVGPYTLIAAARGLNVVAFEPMAENYATLCRNLAHNNLMDSVTPLPFALGDEDALIWLHLSDMRSGSASHLLSGSSTKRTFHKQVIPLLTGMRAIELWGLALPHMIKLDVDGFEWEVLKGIEPLLQSETLRLMIVEWRVQNDAARLQWLAERGWNVTEQYPQRGGVYYAKMERARVPVVLGAAV